MANRADWEMLQQSLGNLGNSFVVNRELAERKDDKEKDRQLRQSLMDEQVAARKDASAAQSEHYKAEGAHWKQMEGGQVDVSLQTEDGKGTMHWKGNPDGLKAFMENSAAHGSPLHAINPADVKPPKLGSYEMTTPFGKVKMDVADETQLTHITDLARKMGATSGTASTAAAAPGSAIYEKSTGKVLGNVPSAARINAEKPDVVEEDYPEVKPKPAVPAKPAATHWFRPDEPAVAEVPAVPGSPAHKIKRFIPPGAGASNAAPPSALSPQPLAPAQPLAVPLNGGAVTNAPMASPQAMPGNDAARIMAEAQDAIARGADPIKVRARLLQQYGIQLQ